MLAHLVTRPLSRRLAAPSPAEKQTTRRQARQNYVAPPPKILRRAAVCSDYRVLVICGMRKVICGMKSAEVGCGTVGNMRNDRPTDR